MLRVINSVETPKTRVVTGTAEAKIELEKETVNVVRQMAMTANVLRVDDQFIGLEGSFGEEKVTISRSGLRNVLARE
jgi:hypothetical protein